MKILSVYRNSPKLREFVRFAIVGTLATCIHYGIYLAGLCLLGIDWRSVKNDTIWQTNLVYTIGYVISWCCNLWLTAHFTFKESVNIKRGFGFAISHAIIYGLHISFLNLFLWTGISEQWAPIPVFCCVIPINFILVRTVFKAKIFEK